MDPKQEPVGWAGAIAALTVTGITLLQAFDVNINDQQSKAIPAFLGALIVLVTLLVRSKVTPVAKAETVIDKAYQATAGVDKKPTLTDGKSSLWGFTKAPVKAAGKTGGTSS